jgi:hypothetical protein
MDAEMRQRVIDLNERGYSTPSIANTTKMKPWQINRMLFKEGLDQVNHYFDRRRRFNAAHEFIKQYAGYGYLHSCSMFAVARIHRGIVIAFLCRAAALTPKRVYTWTMNAKGSYDTYMLHECLAAIAKYSAVVDLMVEEFKKLQ